jgi:glycine/D-amino acid oxidase-like deaminating enzyme
MALERRAIIPASLCAEDGQANPRLVAPAFARAARPMGAEIREHIEVEGATRSGATFHRRRADRARPSSVCIAAIANGIALLRARKTSRAGLASLLIS